MYFVCVDDVVDVDVVVEHLAVTSHTEIVLKALMYHATMPIRIIIMTATVNSQKGSLRTQDCSLQLKNVSAVKVDGVKFALVQPDFLTIM